MATRTDNPVLLSHEDAETVTKLLGDYRTRLASHVASTRSPAVRATLQADMTAIHTLNLKITASLWSWE